MMKKVVITGAGGFIGKALTLALLAKQIEVFAIVRTPSKLTDIKSPLLHLIQLEFSEYSKLDFFLDNLEIDVFYHLAWNGKLNGKDISDWSMQMENVKIAVLAMEAAIKSNVKKFVFCGSSYSYMYRKENDGQEIYCNVYGIAKKNAADLCRAMALQNNIQYNTAVLTNTFGVGDYSDKAVNTFIRKFVNNEPIHLVQAERLNDWVYIDDTVKGLIDIGVQGKNLKDYYIGHKHIATFGENLLAMRDVLAPERVLAFGEIYDRTEINYRLLNADALFQDTGFKCVSDFKESILKTAEWIALIKKH